MKLIELHIDNFGTLSNFSFNFKDDINTIYQKNGWGKTTLTAFIKAMLYGLKKNTKKDLEENERLKYQPWNGGTYGGTLVFEYQGVNYRIEREFKAKEAQDIYKVYNLNTNKLVEQFNPSVGDVIFEIDVTAFEKSMFIPQKDFDFNFGDSLKAKLANIFGKLDDSQDVQKAITSIKNARSEITKKTGTIATLKSRVSELDGIIREKESSIASIGIIEADLKDLKSKQDELKVEKDELGLKISKIEKVTNKKAKREEAKRKELDINDLKVQYERALERTNGNDISQVNIFKLEETLGKIEASNIKLNNIKTDIENDITWVAAFNKFNGKELTDETIEEIKNQISEYTNLNTPVVNMVENKTKKISTPSLILLIVGLVLLLGGIGTIFANLIIGIVITILGFVALIISVLFIALNNNHPTINYEQNNNSEKIDLENKLKAFFNKYQMYNIDFGSNIAVLEVEYKNYLTLKEKMNSKKTDITNLNNDINDFKLKLDQVLNMFILYTDTYKEKINELRKLKEDLESLNKTIIEEQNKYDSFIKDNELDIVEEDENLDSEVLRTDLKELDRQIDEITEKINDKGSNLKAYYEDERTVDDDKNLREEIKNQIASLTKKEKLLQATSDFLTSTDEKVKETYVKPMSEKVEKYMDELLNKDTLEFAIDTDFKFNGLEDSKQREIKYYSRGYQQAISICLRLSLIDCLFKSEKPFLLLDDPFVDLDDDKLALAKDVIKKIANDKQVIYLTCHNSRVI